MKGTTVLALLVRISIALLTRTFFQPDEYFQSLEVAHSLVFGYGHLTWEWVASSPIRSILYPALNVPLYWFLRETGLDDSRFLVDMGFCQHLEFTLSHAMGQIWLPKVLHGALAALTDIWLCELTRKVIGERYVLTSVGSRCYIATTVTDDLQLLLSLTSIFHGLALSRSLSNALETSLTTIALSYFPWHPAFNVRRQVD